MKNGPLRPNCSRRSPSPTGSWQQIYLSDSLIGNLWRSLRPVAGRSGYTVRDDRFEIDFASLASGRYLQVLTNGGASWAALGDGYGRSNWVDPAPQGGSVPEPASLALAVVALAALRWRRRPAAAAG